MGRRISVRAGNRVVRVMYGGEVREVNVFVSPGQVVPVTVTLTVKQPPLSGILWFIYKAGYLLALGLFLWSVIYVAITPGASRLNVVGGFMLSVVVAAIWYRIQPLLRRVIKPHRDLR